MFLAWLAWISGWQANSMKRWAFSRFFAPLRMDQNCVWSMASFHSMARGAPLSATDCSRPFQMLPSTTSLSASICADSAPVSQNFRMDGRTRSSALKARFTSIG